MQIRILRPRGNILMLTLFILFASALLGVLITVIMRDFLKYSKEILHYHQANALAKTASELGFYLIWSTKVGFDFASSGGSILDNNFTCPRPKKDEKCWFSRAFTLNIEGLKSQLSGTLLPGRSLILPTFFTKVQGFQQLSSQSRRQMPTLEGADLTIKLVREENGTTVIDDPSQLWEGKQNLYYIITNSSTEQSYLINLQSKEGKDLFYGNFKMRVMGVYWEKTVARDYDIAQTLPDFLQGDNYLQGNL